MVIVGMDVHVRNSYIHATDVAGRLLRRGRCGNRLGELTEFLSSVEQATQAQGQPIHVVLESTTHSRAIQRMLTCYGGDAGLELTAEVLGARKLRVIAESVSKCDRLDAAVLNELARSNLKLPVCHMPDDEDRPGAPQTVIEGRKVHSSVAG